MTGCHSSSSSGENILATNTPSVCVCVCVGGGGGGERPGQVRPRRYHSTCITAWGGGGGGGGGWLGGCDVITAIREHQVLIIGGESGSGKTTQIPQYLHHAVIVSVGVFMWGDVVWVAWCRGGDRVRQNHADGLSYICMRIHMGAGHTDSKSAQSF